MRSIILGLVIFASTFAQDRERMVVNIAQGPVHGYRDPEYDIFVFYDIPYATAPTGPQKFKAPLPPPQWTQAFEAESRGIVCPQGIDWGLKMQEDCLVASIYVPASRTTKLPVVVYVHGGRYEVGYGNMLTPKNLVNSQEVIVVTFNYRLGTHGFLCLGTEDVPGNAGLKDQLTLLRWVNSNIENFGGDHTEVTIAGYSAGASAVDLLRISKTTKGLFKRVITESGAHLAFFSVQVDPINNAKDYAKSLNFNVDNMKDIFELEAFYKSLSYEQMFLGELTTRNDDTLSMIPCVEREMLEENILTESPYKIVKDGNYVKYPLLYGFTNMEGLLTISGFDEDKDKMNAKFSDFLPVDLKFDRESDFEDVGNKVKQFYFGDISVGTENVLSYIDFQSDVIFIYPMLRSVKLEVEAGHNQIYLYEYSFFDENTPVVPHTDVRGADHCAQTYMVLDHDATNTTEAHKEMAERMRRIWLSFIVTGNPIPVNSSLPRWLPAGTNSIYEFK